MTQQDDKFRVNRGGSWINNSDICRSANRSRHSPDYRYDYLGFRVLRSSEVDDKPRVRVYRGGCWGSISHYCDSAYRNWNSPGSRGHILGFRVIKENKHDE